MSSYTLKDRLKMAREEAGLTQTDVANRMGLTRGAVAQWETGRASPSYANLMKFSQVVNRPMAMLLDSDAAAEIELSGIHETGAFDVPPKDGEVGPAPDLTARLGEVFWKAAEFKACQDAPAAMQDCFEREVAPGIRADYYDGKHLAELKVNRADTHGLGQLLLLEKMIKQPVAKFMLVYSSHSPSDEQRRLARAAGVALMHFNELNAAAAMLRRLYCGDQDPPP